MTDDLERRLRDTLRAYADVVEPPDDDSLPARAAAPRPVLRRWRGAIVAAAAVAAVVTGALVVVDVRDTGSGTTAGSTAQSALSGPGDTRAEAPESASGTASGQAFAGDAASADAVGLPPSPEPGVAYAVDLYTHCGIRGIDLNGVWFAADEPLVVDDSPPPGWGDPDQHGSVTMLTSGTAVFRDGAGHEVRLHADESARPPLCR